MAKEYSVEEIRELCMNAKLTITNTNASVITALNTKNGMTHVFRIKTLDPNDYITPIKPMEHIKQEILVTKQDDEEEKVMQQVAQDEKARILESFKKLHNHDDKDEYVLHDIPDIFKTDIDKETDDFAMEPVVEEQPAILEPKKKPVITAKKTKGKKKMGRPKGSKNKEKD